MGDVIRESGTFDNVHHSGPVVPDLPEATKELIAELILTQRENTEVFHDDTAIRLSEIERHKTNRQEDIWLTCARALIQGNTVNLADVPKYTDQIVLAFKQRFNHE